MGSHPASGIHVGCSGWNYKSWRNEFYPTGVPTSQWLRYYASRFDTVEINNSFYRLPESATFAAWRRQTPSDFCMAVKASRYLTHLKQLRDPREPLARLYSRLRGLGARLGPVLFQLPPHLKLDLPRLETFLRSLARHRRRRRPTRHVIEFRHPSWYVPDAFAMLEAHGVAVCWHDKTEGPYRGPHTGPFVYVRFHGTSGHYFGSYDDRQLRRWAVLLEEHHAAGREIYAYFNNDPEATATRNAMTLRRYLAASS